MGTLVEFAESDAQLLPLAREWAATASADAVLAAALVSNAFGPPVDAGLRSRIAADPDWTVDGLVARLGCGT